MKGELTYRLFDLVNRRRVIPALRRALDRQGWQPRALEADARRRLEEILRLALERVPFYRDKMRGNTLDLGSFPILGRAEFRRESHRLLLGGAERRLLRRVQSGGSTGEPATVWLDRQALDAQSAATLRHHVWMGVGLVCRHLLLWGPPPGQVSYATAAGRLRGLLLRRRFVHSWSLDGARAAAIRALIERTRPRLVVGYSGALDSVAVSGPPLTRPPDAVVAAAEILYPAQRRRIERFFSAPVYERYGCNEFASIAQQCRGGALHINSDRVVLEVLRADGSPAGPGEVGEAVVTDLDNRSMPLIRYRLGDAVEPGGPCECGLPFPTLAAVHGRMVDLLGGAGGASVSPRQVAVALEPSGDILEHQVRIRGDGTLLVLVRTRGGLDSAAAEGALMRLFSSPVNVQVAPTLERWPSGKTRPVVVAS